MATRRTLFHRKEKSRSVSRIGLLLCLLLAGGVMLVPASSDVLRHGKAKLLDMALFSGFIDFEDCVVTPSRSLACQSGATGTPLAVALRQIEDAAAQAAEDRVQRQKAESKVRELALENQRLAAQVKKLATAPAGSFPPAGKIKPTGITVPNPSTGSLMSTRTAPRQSDADIAITPPSEED
jgi:hypothetical protein